MDMEYDMKIGIYDGLTKEQIEREATPQEIAQREAEIAFNIEEEANTKAQEQNLRDVKVAAYQKLGLTEAEIEALLPLPVEIFTP
jgi:hypothetical protein